MNKHDPFTFFQHIKHTVHTFKEFFNKKVSHNDMI